MKRLILQGVFAVLCLLTVQVPADEHCSGAEFQEHFDDVLLVIHYNHPYYNSIEFEKSLYGNAFNNIAFYGDRGSNPTEAKLVESNGGFYFSRVVADVLREHPGYTGYIFLQDDCLMNFWNLKRFDKNKIWFTENSPEGFVRADITSTSWGWQFGAKGYGMDSIIAIYDQISPEEKAMMASSFGLNIIPGAACDMFYLPGRFSQQAIHLCDLFKNTFCELSIACILSYLEPISNFERCNFLWMYNAGTDAVAANYTADLDWAHPLKFSGIEGCNFAISMFEEHFYSKLKE